MLTETWQSLGFSVVEEWDRTVATHSAKSMRLDGKPNAMAYQTHWYCEEDKRFFVVFSRPSRCLVEWRPSGKETSASE